MIQISKILNDVPIFRMLGKESIDFIIERLKFRTYDANHTICKIGDPGDTMYIIISGGVDIIIQDQEGNEQVVASSGSGDYFGEMALLTGEPRSATVRTTEPSEMFLLVQKDFDVILEKFPSISLSMSKVVSKRLRETLSKASVLPRKAVKDAGPSGSLSETPLIDLINFCESNSLTGTLTITNEGKEGVFTYSRGEVISIKMDDKSDDSALDEMLKWEDGKFEIKSKPLTLDAKKEAESKDTKEILIVNNSLVVRKLIERAFRSLGYKVATAENVEKSKATIGQSIPDIVITDVKLADGLGLDLCKTVREDKDIPFIFLADDSVKSEFSDELKSLGKAELTKTHEVSEIVKLVENML
ncbi:MAG: cyclic nucleotide-binding domain-containing protein [Calditrichia bacterium]|jgi:CRP-like cAMP-binding protein/CheY-like chemotaxis protein|nr:cyclic nucleotide-binding domain-containing protein [Calditrichia bacterium]